jgi:acyl carrier protein
MPDQRAAILADLRALLGELSRRLGTDAGTIDDADIIPDAGALDSAGLLEFVVLIDEKYTLALEPEDMTIDNLGSLAAIADFVIARRAPGRA